MICDFVDDFLIEYEKLHTNYVWLEIAPSETETLTWRDDHKFLFNYAKPTSF